MKLLLAIVGPTAIGKTTLAIALAKYFGTEIISADSRQFYKEMKIGTAVPSKDELADVPHHFIQHKSILEPYTVGDFEHEAMAKLDELFRIKNIAVMVGGSGLYIDAITKGLDNFPKVSPKIRSKLNDTYKKNGIKALQEQLKILDPTYYSKVDRANPHRLIRALEICLGTGSPYSTFLNQKRVERPFETFTIGISADRPIIYDRINERVDVMIATGLIQEAERLYKYRSLNALQTVGYTELFKYLDGEWSLEFAISEIKKNTRRFAKRQLTWFRKGENTLWVDYQDDISGAISVIEKKLESA
ncbi:tRNA (adenosine(37)-N6)-dimethylallyltransferase MiaA [Maribacter algicola]|uniref:tRNA (Adenosine(37)-N6)-dimethylallyltransferase MiaA n=1 Tax=Meishania litoralis TaxID=3434685 RepID=A0ACC7LMA8_9FLAO